MRWNLVRYVSYCELYQLSSKWNTVLLLKNHKSNGIPCPDSAFVNATMIHSIAIIQKQNQSFVLNPKQLENRNIKWFNNNIRTLCQEQRKLLTFFNNILAVQSPVGRQVVGVNQMPLFPMHFSSNLFFFVLYTKADIESLICLVYIVKCFLRACMCLSFTQVVNYIIFRYMLELTGFNYYNSFIMEIGYFTLCLD